MKKAAVVQASLRSKHWSDDEPVIPAHKIRKDKSEAPRPVFGDDQWNLVGFISRSNISNGRCIADFTKFSNPVARITAKELIMQRLNIPLGSFYSKAGVLDPVSVRCIIVNLLKFYKFMTCIGVDRLVSLTQDHLNAYLGEITRAN